MASTPEAALRRKPVSTRTYLLGLLGAVAIPVIAFAAYLFSYYSASEQQRYGDQAMQIAGLMSRVVDSELQSLTALLRGLSSTSSLQRGDLVQVYAEARRLTEGTDSIILLRDLERGQLLNTQVPFGTSLPPAVELTADERAQFMAGRPVIGRVYMSPISGEARVPVAVPVQVGGATTYVLAITVPTTHIRDILVPAVPDGWTVTAGDAAGIIVARSRRHEEFTGKPGLPQYIEQAVGPSGSFKAVGFDGIELVAGYANSPVSGWLYAANIPINVVQGPSWQSLAGIAAAGLLALLLSLVLAFVFTHRFSLATQGLMDRALALGRGEPVLPLDTRIEELRQVAGSLSTAAVDRRHVEEQLRARSHELEVILDTVPAAVWFTYGHSLDVVRRNRRAASLMRMPADDTASLASGAATHLRVYRNGALCPAEQLPLQRALRGEDVDDEEFVFVFDDGSEQILLTSSRPLRSDDGAIAGAVSVSIDITERIRSEEQRRLLTNELNHRVKNALATVQSLAAHTLRGAPSLKAAEHTLGARLSALAAAHDALTRENWEGADIHDLVQGAVQSQVPLPSRLRISGPRLWLAPNAGLALTLALHELATNAVKHGAFSVEMGRVDLTWAVEQQPESRMLRLIWTETDGPPLAAPPERQGFGTRLLHRLFRGDGGDVALDYRPEGLVCTILIALPAPVTRSRVLPDALVS